MASDFGKVSIDLNEIDNYRNENGCDVLTITHQGIKKVKFTSDGQLDRLIAEKECFYVTQKKN